MPRLSEQFNKAFSLQFGFEGETYTISYRPFGQDLVDTLLESDELRDQARFNVRLLARVLTRWDMTEDDGSVIPITESNITRLPMVLQNLFVSKITEDQQPGKRRDGQSGATLRHEEATTTNRYPNGSSGSKPVAILELTQ